MPESRSNLCMICNGTGELNGEFHHLCLGTGYAADRGLNLFLKGLMDKTDGIIAEQASQREDLTAILTQIWNKVKDL